jgi:predicted transcriptional regulator
MIMLRIQTIIMNSEAVIQNDIVKILIREKGGQKLKQISYMCPYTYHQVASAITALVSKGFVKKVSMGTYEVTEIASIMELEPDFQIKILQKKVAFLENELKNLTDRFVRASYK